MPDELRDPQTEQPHPGPTHLGPRNRAGLARQLSTLRWGALLGGAAATVAFSGLAMHQTQAKSATGNDPAADQAGTTPSQSLFSSGGFSLAAPQQAQRPSSAFGGSDGQHGGDDEGDGQSSSVSGGNSAFGSSGTGSTGSSVSGNGFGSSANGSQSQNGSGSGSSSSNGFGSSSTTQPRTTSPGFGGSSTGSVSPSLGARTRTRTRSS